MAKPGLKVQFFNNFTGGPNNNQSRQNLLETETPECMDIVFNARGGFASRRGYRTTTVQSVLNGGYIGGQFSAGTEVLWGIDSTGGLWTWTGSTFTDVTTSSPADMSRTVRGTAWDDRLYFANWLNGASLLQRYWDGSAFTTLGNTANNNYTSPSGGNAPLSRLIASHSGHMFWADTVESGTRYRSRLRYSHPLQPEDFADSDYFDIEPDDQTNQITALVPFKDMMLIFKQRGVFALYGYDRDTFIVERVSTRAGVFSQEQVDVNSGVCYWWSTDGNVYAFNGRGVVPIGDRIVNVVYEGTVNAGNEGHRVLWGENRLFISLVKATGGRLLFMYDPAVGQSGAWTQFSYAPSSMFWWVRNDGDSQIQFILPDVGILYDLGNPAQEQDESNGTNTPIDAWYRTAWFTAQDTALKKRWRRPTVTIAANDDCILNVEVYHDFNESSPNRTLTMPVTSTSGDMVWGDDWGSLWAGSDPVYKFDRLGSPGRSNAVQFLFRVTGHSSRWWTDSYALPYYEKAYR
jgi:hypothetical protein